MRFVIYASINIKLSQLSFSSEQDEHYQIITGLMSDGFVENANFS